MIDHLAFDLIITAWLVGFVQGGAIIWFYIRKHYKIKETVLNG